MIYRPVTIDGEPYLASHEYAHKYGIDKRKLAAACRAAVLLSRKVDVTVSGRTTYRWFILDKPPDQHPDWLPYQKVRQNSLRASGAIAEEAFDVKVEKLQNNFLTAWLRRGDGASYFPLKQVAQMVGVSPETVRRWTEIGVEGYGKLPRVTSDISKVPGRNDVVYHQQDIMRFLRKEVPVSAEAPPTLDDALRKTNIEEIIEQTGWYVYDASAVFPLTYKGFMDWCAKYIRMPGHKPFKPKPKQMELYRKAFEYDNRKAELRHRCICISRPRGDFKSFDACLLFLFRFFNLPNESIFLVANTVKQTTHLLFEEAAKIIRRSPLSRTPGLDIQKDTIYLWSGRKDPFNKIEIMSIEGGTRSNATCFAFSEIYKLDNEKAFAEIDGSIRAVPNAWTIIESTVAPRGHVFHRLFEAFQRNEDPVLYFQYYSDEAGYQNPGTTPEQLQHYRTIFMPAEFNMFFRNRWEDAVTGLFDASKILAMNYIGIDGARIPEAIPQINEACIRLVDLKRKLDNLEEDHAERAAVMEEMRSIERRLIPVSTLYSLPANYATLGKLKEVFGCDFILGVGLDRAKQMQQRSDRTVLMLIAKGIISESSWFAFILDVYVPRSSTLEGLCEMLSSWSNEYGWIDYIDIEEYLGKDLYDWCVARGYTAELVAGSYKHQFEIFTTAWQQVDAGMVKCPPVPVYVDDVGNIHYGIVSHRNDLLREEMSACVHYPSRDDRKSVGYFGSPYKVKTGRTRIGEAKDDSVFAFAHALFSCNRGDFAPPRDNTMQFSASRKETDVIGAYEPFRRNVDAETVALNTAFGRLLVGQT